MKREAKNFPLLMRRGGRKVSIRKNVKTGERIRSLILWSEKGDAELYMLDDKDNAYAVRDYSTIKALCEEWREV